MTIRASVSIAVASVLVGASSLFGTLAMPIANADDPLAPIIAAVKGDRAKTRCAQLTYNPVLEDGAQKYARSERAEDSRPSNYNGGTEASFGSGDPQAVAINNAYKKGASDAIGMCNFTEFGVGFIRHDDRSVDVVAIIFGEPAVENSNVPAPVPRPVQCPAGSPSATVPAGQACAPSTHSVTVAVTPASFGKINVTLTNSADNAVCAYTAAPLNNPLGILPTIHKTVAVKAKGAVTLNENAPPPTTAYNVSVPCTGTFNGNTVGLGDSSQTVSG